MSALYIIQNVYTAKQVFFLNIDLNTIIYTYMYKLKQKTFDEGIARITLYNYTPLKKHVPLNTAVNES